MNLYFSYGSNMWREQMNNRCPDHHYFGNGILKGYRWIISDRGYANIVESDTDEVHGVVYKITEADELSLDEYEGVQKGSFRKEIKYVEIAKMNFRCLVYIDPVAAVGKPKDEYVNRIKKGVADANLPGEYVDAIYVNSYILIDVFSSCLVMVFSVREII